MKLVILESPTKTKALTRYLGDKFLVLSSNGHINKLSKKGKFYLGIDLKTFFMDFEVDELKKNIINKISKEAKKASEIYIATDPDREGEAIAFHIKNILPKDKNIFRVTFNEITKKAVKKAFENPGKLNKGLIESQFTRRALDRILGFRLSSLLQKKIYSRSAGRVQSVALLLIVEREKEIEKFISETFFTIFAKWQNEEKIILINEKLEKLIFKDEKKVDDLLKKINNSLEVFDIKDKKIIKKSSKPFTTATLLQKSMGELNFSSKKVMFLLQKLYEGIEIDNDIVGLITYPRTDSIRINSDFSLKIKEKIKKDFGFEYLKKEKQKNIKDNKSKQKIQDAHEAIRITDINFSIKKLKNFLTNDQLRIYNLIYKRTFSSFMSNVEGITRKYILKDLNTKSLFLFEKEKITFDGFYKIEKPDLLFKNDNFLNLKKGEILKIKKYEKITQVTKPKSRYTESKMIKKMDDLNIGRPSTYSGIVSKLFDWNYVEKNEFKKLIPTFKGKIVNKKLQEFFSELINTVYTAKMEEELDLIALDKMKRVDFLSKFYKEFNKKLEIAEKEMKKPEPKKLDKKCPKCSFLLNEKEGRFGKFIGCSNYPECKYIEKSETNPFLKEPIKLEILCEKCKNNLVERQGRFGKFIGCSNYPECKFIFKKKKSELKKLDKKCPKCKTNLVEKQGRFGKFICCPNYPKCKFIENNKKNK